MSHPEISDEEVFRFILHQIDTVPHLEALLLLWRKRPLGFTESELSAQLFVDANTVSEIVKNLQRRELIAATADASREYRYEAKSAYTDALMQALSDMYSRELISISKLIHSKTASAAQDFARAFKFTKDREK
jgi:predicted transcriptional regulator